MISQSQSSNQAASRTMNVLRHELLTQQWRPEANNPSPSPCPTLTLIVSPTLTLILTRTQILSSPHPNPYPNPYSSIILDSHAHPEPRPLLRTLDQSTTRANRHNGAFQGMLLTQVGHLTHLPMHFVQANDPSQILYLHQPQHTCASTTSQERSIRDQAHAYY